jgi:3-oxoadipate enol-lactonase
MPTARINGVDIYYEDSSGPGPALLFSHGFLMDHEMFAPQIEALRGRYRCIAWDERGFGKTGPVDQPFSYWDSGRDALGLLAHLNITAATLIGMSQGGFLSMRAALLEPERVKALVLISTRSGLDAPEIVANFHQLRAEWLANGCANVKGCWAICCSARSAPTRSHGSPSGRR